MKKITYYLLIVLFIASCSSKKEVTKVVQVVEEKVESVADTKNYTLSKGTIHWVGAKTAYDHRGTVDVTTGIIQAEGNKILSGEFVIDMNTIKNTDLPEDKKSKLEGHLKSADFFDINIFPKASFIIKSVEAKEMEESNYLISGTLTMKSISKDVTFPALVVVKDGVLNAISDKFFINRTNWEIKYASTSAGAPEDKAINDDVQIQIELIAK